MAWGIRVVKQTPAPGAENAEPVTLIPVGFPCLERGRLYKKKLYIDCLQEAGFETLKQRREKIFKDFARKTYDSEMFGNKRYQEKEPSSYALRNERNKQEQHTNVCIIPPYRNQINDETQGAVQ